jgi:4-methylaminobutanoate oxidase (formaldehyde-forming)
MHWPDLQPKTARDLRRSPLHDRLAAAGACFGEVNGYEQPTWYAPAGVEPRDEYSFGRPNWFAYAGEEHQAARTAVALFDLSANATVDVSGADALALLQWLTTSDCDMASGRATHTPFLNERGGLELEATVVRRRAFASLSSFRLAGTHQGIGDPESRRARPVGPAARSDLSVIVTDVSAAYAGLAPVGPRGPELLAEVEVGYESVLCLSREVAGGPQLELLVSSDQAVDLYDEMVAAGHGLGLRHAGSRALDSLRVENGVRRSGTTSVPPPTPSPRASATSSPSTSPAAFAGTTRSWQWRRALAPTGGPRPLARPGAAASRGRSDSA